jgi:hypothetical protein
MTTSVTNVFCHFDPLEEVWVGDSWPEEFYFDLKPEVRSVLGRITEMAKRDLDQLSTVLKSLGVKVRRPEFDSDSNYYRDKNGLLLRPPIPIRDDNLVLGSNLMFHLRNEYPKDPWQTPLDEYRSLGATIIDPDALGIFGYLQPPSIVRVGKDILIDKDSHAHSWECVERDFIPLLLEKGYRVSIAETDGHVDSIFSVLKPGHILTSHWKDSYHNEYPGWDIHRIPKRNKPWAPHRIDNTLAWWIRSERGHQYPVFNEWVANNAKAWIGNPEETVFTVNSLVVNEGLFIITGGHPEKATRDWLKKIGVEYIHVEFEAGTFFDSGIHCATVDIRRQGQMRDFFPDRTEKIYRF